MEISEKRFLFGDRELLLTVADLLSAPVEVIVNSAEPTLQHVQGMAQTIRQRAGSRLQEDSDQLIREYGVIDPGMAVYTSAGELPYKAIIHAVPPPPGDREEQRKLEQAVSRSLQLCDMNEWRSVGFPLIGTEAGGLPLALCAQAFYRAITRFWDARQECAVEQVRVYLLPDQFQAFSAAFHEHEGATQPTASGAHAAAVEENIGEISLSESEIADLDDSDIDSWFK
ncbi:MAG: hypothetical protein GC149_12095 [Gammaproteobacteria bacterium]|nr:hypothetical protein [Gammaproteobacteria bacterium]